MLFPVLKKDILLVAHGLVMKDPAAVYLTIVLDQGTWDFEGEHILFDNITIVVFADVGSAAGGDGLASYAWGEAILEIDWKDINNKDLDDYLREHVFARAGSEAP